MDRVWEIVTEEVPDLFERVKEILRNEGWRARKSILSNTSFKIDFRAL